MKNRAWILGAGVAALVAGVYALSAQPVSQPVGPAGIAGAYNSGSQTCISGTACWAQVDLNGNLKVAIASGGGSGGTASTFGAAFPATGTAVGFTDGTNMVAGTVDGSGFIKVNCSAGCAGGSFNNNADNVATSATNGQSAAWNYVWDGSAWDRLYGDSTNGAFVNVKTSVLPTGASTAAIQSSVIGTKNAGTAAASSQLVGGVYNSTPLTLTDTQQASLQFDANGFLKVNTAAGAAAGGTSSNFGSGFPTPGTAIGFTDGTNMVAARVGAVANIAAATNFVNALGIAQYNATPLTVTDTRYQSLQSDINGFLKVNVANTNANLATNADAIAAVAANAAGAGSPVNSANYVWNGTTWDRQAGTTAGTKITAASGSIASGAVASGAVASGAYASGSIASGAMVDVGAQADSACSTDNGTCTLIALTKRNNQRLTTVNSSIGAANAYETVAASQTAQALGATGATGDYLSHCVVTPGTTSPGVVTILDNATAIVSFAGGASSTSNLVPFTVPIGAISVSGAWKITTGANVTVVCVGRFT